MGEYDAGCEHMRLKYMASIVNDLHEENERLKVENAKLREQVDAAHMSRLLTENENEKLRELVRDVWHLFTEHGAVNPCDLPVVDAVRDRMRELGVDTGDAID